MLEHGAALPRMEYVSDVPYPRNFVPELAPAGMRLAVALCGHAAPPGDDFDYCELGAGRGDTLVTLAASSPEARFVGVDLIAEHVAFARGLAERGEVGNVRFLEHDFADPALLSELPDFDYVVAHGVLSWVSPAKRAAVFRFAKAKLKPGGLLLASYNALPGWAAIEPLRRLMLDHAAKVPGSRLDQAREAYAYACRLAAAKAGYFVSHPTAQKMLELMKAGGLAYIVHEYFHEHWHPLYSADVAREAGEHDLVLVAQVPLYLNIPELALPPGVQELAGSTPDPLDRESLKDLALNELFRRDVFARGPQRPDALETRRFFEETRFGTLTTEEHVLREIPLPFCTIDYKAPAYRALIPLLSEAPATAVELARRPELARLGQAQIGHCLRNLSVGGQIVPMRPPAGPAPRAERYRVPSPWNRSVLAEGLGREGTLALASPVIATGVTVSLLDAIFLHLLTEVEPEGHSSWLRRFAETCAFPIVLGGTRINNTMELVRRVAVDIERRRAFMGPKLCQLGILDVPPVTLPSS